MAPANQVQLVGVLQYCLSVLGMKMGIAVNRCKWDDMLLLNSEMHILVSQRGGYHLVCDESSLDPEIFSLNPIWYSVVLGGIPVCVA